MGKFKNWEEFKNYKASLENRIEDLEKSIDFSPSGLINAINPFRSKKVASSFDFMSLAKQLFPFLLTKVMGKKYAIFSSALVPIVDTGASKMIAKIEESNFIDKLFIKLDEATKLSTEEELILKAAEIEEQIAEETGRIAQSEESVKDV